MRVVACRGRIQVAALIQARVESVDLVPKHEQKTDENGSDVPSDRLLRELSSVPEGSGYG